MNPAISTVRPVVGADPRVCPATTKSHKAVAPPSTWDGAGRRRPKRPKHKNTRHLEQGFTLIEVVVALAILAVSLTVLLETQIASLRAAGRSRDLTIAALLCRSKMADIEQQLFDDGFTVGDVEEDGNFSEEGYPKITWKAKIVEVQLDLSMIGSITGGDGEGNTPSTGSIVSGMAGSFETFVQEVGRSVRVISLTVTWPDGKYHDSINVRSLVTREDLSLVPAQTNEGGMLP